MLLKNLFNIKQESAINTVENPEPNSKIFRTFLDKTIQCNLHKSFKSKGRGFLFFLSTPLGELID